MVLIFGSSAEDAPADLGGPAISLEPIDDDRRLAAVYSVAGVFVVPFLQEVSC